ncbi:hypothetical protein DFQ01_11081 [Paenibacillus cellulosilyticus]|uniref:Uncharacterized protein n=1 Tax=Paenibacillus cellulosilyticus TaxID=375489 RepID=A0A2V2YT35_9BACL|nr:hypothetical protein [Paenibacillus cellulosilyticus]PWW01191.1 hypothetical protein DFQ01_11081 [Paenibacillus cellulosilyticus]QKS46853.1 hypothetical protein HUB94_20430 [Paenibacillus cellulosilyticus]
MLEWIKYDPMSRAIESHRNHLVTDGHRVLIAQHAKVIGTGEYSWMINDALIGWVTHWATINLPVEEDQRQPIDYKTRYEALVQSVKDGLGEWPPAKSAEDLAGWIESTCPFVGDLWVD